MSAMLICAVGDRSRGDKCPAAASVIYMPGSYVAQPDGRGRLNDVRGGGGGVCWSFQTARPPGPALRLLSSFGLGVGSRATWMDCRSDDWRGRRRRRRRARSARRGGVVRRQRLRFNYQIRSAQCGVHMTLVIDCAVAGGRTQSTGARRCHALQWTEDQARR